MKNLSKITIDIIRLIPIVWMKKLTEEKLAQKIILVIASISASLNSRKSLRFLLTLENSLYTLTGTESCRYGNGVHTKHKHTAYHNFFIKNISTGETVLDVGCGNGALAYDVAQNIPGVNIYGIDLSEENIDFAKSNFQHENLEFVVGDALIDLPGKRFDVVILSNVLEHIEHRVEFLKGVVQKIRPKRILIRVPLFERDWRVPLMKELEIDYRLDSTHFVEFLYEDLEKELNAAGLEIVKSEFKWGEVWAVTKSDIK